MESYNIHCHHLNSFHILKAPSFIILYKTYCKTKTIVLLQFDEDMDSGVHFYTVLHMLDFPLQNTVI